MAVPSTLIRPSALVKDERVDRRLPFSSMASAPALRSSPSVMTNCAVVSAPAGSEIRMTTPGPWTATVPALISACTRAFWAASSRASCWEAAFCRALSRSCRSARLVRSPRSWVVSSSRRTTRSCSDRESMGSWRCERTCVTRANPRTMHMTSRTACGPRGTAQKARWARSRRRWAKWSWWGPWGPAGSSAVGAGVGSSMVTR